MSPVRDQNLIHVQQKQKFPISNGMREDTLSKEWYKRYDQSFKLYPRAKNYINIIHLKKLNFFNEVPKDSIILDIGCGNGNLLETLYIKDYNKLFGFDIRISPSCTSNRDKFNLKEGSMLDIPFPNEFADVQICFNVMHHLQNEMEYSLFLRQVHKKLKIGGVLYLVEPEDNFFRKLQKFTLSIPGISDISFLRNQKIALNEEETIISNFCKTDIDKLIKSSHFTIRHKRSFLKSVLLKVVKEDL